MAKPAVTDLWIYRWRYRLGYGLIGLLLVAMLYVSGIFAPGGLSETEMRSVVRTAALNASALTGGQPEQLLHLPYRALQKVSFDSFGVSLLSLKLPSLLLAAASVVLFYGIVRLWFRRNVAVITTLLLASTEQFLLQSQQATPLISYLFWGTALLFAASMIARARRARPLWLILTAVVAGLSLYSTFMIYIIITLIVTAIVHPHARFVVFKQPLWAKLVSLLLFAVLVTPIVLTIIQTPMVALNLLGVSAERPLSDSIVLSGERALAYINVLAPQNTSFLAPAYGLGTLLLAVLGGYRLFSAKYTAKSYIVTLWLIFIAVTLVINPAAIGFTLLPIMILVAFAIDYLIRSWYKLFPRNPYARFVGLVPLTVLVLSLSFSGIERFVYGYHYNPEAAAVYRNDVTLLNRTIAAYPEASIAITPAPDEREFYQTYAAYSSRDITVLGPAESSNAAVRIVAGNVLRPADQAPSRIVTSGISNQPDRFYVYENQTD